jgi:glycosyltransferase involved in cell wall biosynthesis
MQYSIIVPAYNEEVLLADTLRRIKVTMLDSSANLQSELIVVDDQSTDSTPEIAMTLADKVITGQRTGIGSARNSGANAASGDCFIFVDADTQVPKNLIQTIDNHRRTGTRGGAVAPCYQGQTRLMKLYFTLWAKYAQRNDMVQGVCQFIDADAFEQLGGFSEALRHAEDNDLHQRLKALVRDSDGTSQVSVISEIRVLPSMRRYHQSSTLWTILVLNPLVTRVKLTSETFWRKWYDKPPR